MDSSDHDDVDLNHVLTFKDDLPSLANGESEMIRADDPLYGDDRRAERRSRGRIHGRGRTKEMLHGWAESFRRDSKSRMTPTNAFTGGEREHQGRNYYDLRAANYRTAHPLLAKELKGRHLQMIAIGGSIGELKFFIMAGWDSSFEPVSSLLGGQWSRCLSGVRCLFDAYHNFNCYDLSCFRGFPGPKRLSKSSAVHRDVWCCRRRGDRNSQGLLDVWLLNLSSTGFSLILWMVPFLHLI